MNAIRAVTALGPMDAKSVLRDPLLRWFGFFPILIGLVMRLGYPLLSSRILALTGFDLTAYNFLIASFLVLCMPLMTGMVIGFLFLDQRDDQTLRAIQVTPLSLTGYLAYRVTLPMLLNIVAIMIALPLSNLIVIDGRHLLISAAASAPMAPIFALFLASTAQNKIQGFAIMKGAGSIIMPPLIAYFIPSAWQLAFGVIPTYWPAKIFWMLSEGQPAAPLYLVVGVAYQLLWVWLLLKRFNQVMEK